MSEREQAENLIEFAAHPNARADLTKAARQMGLLD
jgi:acyl-CoA hydrolase